MEWTIDHYKHYSSEHLQKADKNRIRKELEKTPTPLRKGILGKRRATVHNI